MLELDQILRSRMMPLSLPRVSYVVLDGVDIVKGSLKAMFLRRWKDLSVGCMHTGSLIMRGSVAISNRWIEYRNGYMCESFHDWVMESLEYSKVIRSNDCSLHGAQMHPSIHLRAGVSLDTETCRYIYCVDQ